MDLFDADMAFTILTVMMTNGGGTSLDIVINSDASSPVHANTHNTVQLSHLIPHRRRKRHKRKWQCTNDETCCSCCLEPLNTADVVVLPQCQHTFHLECVLQLVRLPTGVLCPLCRTPIQKEDLHAIMGKQPTVRHLQRCHQTLCAIQDLQTCGPCSDQIFLQRFARAVRVRLTDSLCYNVCIHAIVRSIQLKLMVQQTVREQMADNTDMDYLLQKTINDQLSVSRHVQC